MKWLLNSVVTTVICLLFCAKYASSILCYDCNSAFDPRCGQEFDSFSLGIVNCSLRDPPEHLDPIEPTFCRATKMEYFGKTRIVRTCGYLNEDDSKDTPPCRRVVGNGDLFVTYCTCNTDLCNSGVVNGIHKMALLSMLMFASVLC